jgi:hypothetical protein
MPDPASQPAPGTTSRGKRLLSWLLTAFGLGLFVYLVVSSGITLDLLARFGPVGFALLLAISAVNIAVDAVAWYYAVRHVARPTPLALYGVRIAGDAFTNALPGGVVLGETYKATMLKRLWGISTADNVASLLTVKFGLALSQAVFILAGCALSFSDLRARSHAVFGFEGAELVAITLTVGFGLLLLIPLALMIRGDGFTASCRQLARLPIPPLRRALERSRPRIEALDASCVRLLRGNARRLALVFGYLLLGWLVGALESMVLLAWFGLSRNLRIAYVMESVGSMFRLIFFFVPSGIGGQDASFVALFKLYGFPPAQGGAFVLLKRCKELFWIGLGFLIAVLKRPAAERPPA